MLNQVILVGKIHMILPRGYGGPSVVLEVKSVSDEEEPDMITVRIDEDLMESTGDYLAVGSTIGVKACLSVKTRYINVVAEKITFIKTCDT